MRTLVMAGLLVVTAWVGAYAVDEAADLSKVVSALGLERGTEAVVGRLQKPLGTPMIIEGSCVEPRNGAKLANSLLITSTDSIAWGAGVDLEIRSLPMEKGKHYKLEGYESGEFVGAPDAIAP